MGERRRKATYPTFMFGLTCYYYLPRCREWW